MYIVGPVWIILHTFAIQISPLIYKYFEQYIYLSGNAEFVKCVMSVIDNEFLFLLEKFIRYVERNAAAAVKHARNARKKLHRHNVRHN